MIRLDSISNQVVFNTVRMVANLDGGGTVSSTGFIVGVSSGEAQIPFIVTTAHSLINAASVTLSVSEASSDGSPSLDYAQTWTLDKSLLSVVSRHPTLDIAAIPFGPVLNEASQRGKPIFFRQIAEDNIVTKSQREELTAFESVVFAGYPLGLHDSKNALPLLRVGSTATPLWSDYSGKPNFLIDAEVFEGSSGSPVFILNEGAYSSPGGITVGTRFFLVGMISGSIDRSNPKDPTSKGEHVGLGIVIHAGPIREYLKEAANKLVNRS